MDTTLKVVERVAEVETILRDPDVIKALDSNDNTPKQEAVINKVNRILSGAAAFIDSEVAKRTNDASDHADESIDLILEGKNLSQETQETNRDSTQDDRTVSRGETINPDSDNIWEVPDETLGSTDGCYRRWCQQ